MKDFIKRYLGITDIEDILSNKLNSLSNDIDNYLVETKKLRGQVETAMVGLGLLLAKLDPILAVSEHDPVRKAESDRLGKEVINRLRAENAARHHQTGD